MKVQSGGAVNPGAKAREDKRKIILEAAVHTFAEKGYFSARMRDVAARAGVADGTVYLYFESKEKLLIDILEDYAKAFVERAERDCQAITDPRGQLRAVLQRHLVSMEANLALATVFQIELRHSRKFLRRVAKGQVASYLNLLQNIVASGIKRGIFRREIDPKVAARAIFGAVDELVTSWVLAQRPGSLQAQLGPLLDFLFFGLCELTARETAMKGGKS